MAPKGKLGVQKKGAVGVKALQISSEEYVRKGVNEIPADERFLHRFATLKFATKSEKGTKGEEYDDDAVSVNSDEFERVMERFEPGEANDDFDIDFGKEFSSEKQKKKKERKRKISDVDGEDDENEEDEDGEEDADGWSDEDLDDIDEDEDEIDDDEDEDEDGEDEMEEDEDEDDEDMEIEGEESDDDYGITQSKKGKRFNDSDESDEDYGENDAFVSADRLAEEMEGFGEEETREARKERLKKKVKRVKGRKVKK
ncbi:hypothetical protein PENTCL1PPCAC_2280 [Pristionchus entomophagus]|uniref:Uncharacterized protein n=1 Tax=Pristionchus entomophagus TaxID=358040 RepID=A0AAV5SKC3_9BILA|nr:hypothetical protein PENTCL1PPCAC_2280 [Pristionchus entomophagus]